MNILLIHQYAGNKGDRAVLFAMCSMIKSVDNSINISVSTSSPELWTGYGYYKEQQIEFIPSAWDYKNIVKARWYWNSINRIKKYTFTVMRECYLHHCSWLVTRFLINPIFYKRIKAADVIISVGGHNFTTILSRDLVSSINFDAMAILSVGKKLSCFSQSFGPFVFFNIRNRILTQKILQECTSLYVRENRARQYLVQLGIPDAKIKDTYESVLSLNSLFKSYKYPSEREKRIGIAIYSTQLKEENRESYIECFSLFANYVIKKGYSVRFFPMELKGSLPDDRPVILDIIKRVDNKTYCDFIDKDLPTDVHLQEVSKCQIFVGHKTHSTIFALATGTPLIGIAYHPKTEEFMKQFSIPQYCIIDKELSSKSLIRKFDNIELEIDQIGESLFNQVCAVSSKIYNDIKEIIYAK